LFHAIVGAGVALGAAAGCSGKTLGSQAADDTRTDAGSDDASGGDADALAPDVFDAALCDAPWPTTKGAPPSPPTCEDRLACATATHVTQCFEPLAPQVCGARVTPICRDAAWVCPSDTVDGSKCWCVGLLQDHECTPTGWVPRDAGRADAASDGG
jgi:hypothetical protein